MNPFQIEHIPNKDSAQSQKKPLANPVETTKQQFEDLLNCHICFCHVSNPMMCPYCSKLFCEGCIRRCLLMKSECPYCRKQVKGSAMMASCNRFVNQLISIVHDLIDHKVQEQICQEHDVLINYFCQTCSEPICCECQMFGSHQGHSLKKLSAVYQARYDVLREMLSEFKAKLKEKELSMKQVEGQLTELKKLKQKHLKELDEFIEQYRVKIISETVSETEIFEKAVMNFGEVIEQLNKLEEELNQVSIEAEKTSKYQLNDDLVNRINEITKREPPKVEQSGKSVMEEIIPPFFQRKFIITNYTKKKKQKTTIFSPIEKCQGSEWRLKIYPNGNENVEGVYLSVFIEMVNTIHESTVYEYQIEIVNRKNPHQRMIREYQSTFQAGESWGYNKYIKLDNLIKEGFVDAVSDELEINYYIRSPFYYNIYRQKETYIQHLDNELLNQEAEIQELQALLHKHKK